MVPTSLIQFIYSTNLVSRTTAELIAQRFAEKSLTKNEYLLKAGQIADTYLFLETGYLRAFAEDVSGNDVTTAFYGPGQMVFEVASFFGRSRSRENVQALISGWYISYAQLNELFHALPEFREFGRSMLARGFSELKVRMLSTITETTEERYRALLAAHPELFQQASLKHIASYLGVTDTSLSRIRASLYKK
ncbi:Crp/Fnr family transcriptional regulator [Mucilaginibacter pocheonensis]|uniref:CRP-like cAMP-binding protein n=1 Tax=Mucilaginibacter pocheonensis TaxID=398050 RepID=A0ABU1TFE2_9SPHI|nr:Crp/Fnr family transcriptional regulator [Mucilaginibacter pocheonensis]MDR6944121.1 CRP-like cAMP-binding protein [Mucilaginibacter pocheonensis]